jgi:hypothetical protein
MVGERSKEDNNSIKVNIKLQKAGTNKRQNQRHHIFWEEDLDIPIFYMSNEQSVNVSPTSIHTKNQMK